MKFQITPRAHLSFTSYIYKAVFHNVSKIDEQLLKWRISVSNVCE